LRRGVVTRGRRYIERTTPAQRSGMELGAHDAMRDWMERGTALDPDSIVTRRPCRVAVETRRGGGPEAMLAFRDASRRDGASPARLRTLDALAERERRRLRKQMPASVDGDDPSSAPAPRCARGQSFPFRCRSKKRRIAV
jgi:hypothetical protein